MEITTQQLVTQIVCWLIVLICYIVLLYNNNVLRKEVKYLEEVRKVYKHKLEVTDKKLISTETERDIYKSKYLDLVYNLPQTKTTADYKQQIIIDYTKNRLSFEDMASKY